VQFPNFDPVIFHIGPLAIRWYALAYVAGILLGWRYAVGLVRNARLWGGKAPTATGEQIDDLILWITLGVIVGGRIGYILFYAPNLIWTEPLEIFQVWKGGMSFHGGFLGVMTAMVLYARRYKLSFWGVMDFVAPLVPLGILFGRIGNFIGGELWGRPVENPDYPFAMIFPHVDHLARHPSQLYEAALEGLLLFAVLWWYSARPRPEKAVAGLFALGYGSARFAVEFSGSRMLTKATSPSTG